MNARVESREVDEIVRRLAAPTPQCYLTFDDGPDPEWTPRVLRALELAGVRATFFVIGREAQRCAGLLREARAAGHVIGSHGFSHRHPWTLTYAAARREVLDGCDAVAQVLGERPVWFRPPHGRLSPCVLDAVRESEQRVALWSVSAVDWGPFATPRRIMSRLRAVRAGDIVLLHDGPLRHNRPQNTLGVLPAVLARMARRGPAPAPLPRLGTMSG